MTSFDGSLPIEELLAEGDWVRRVAAAIVGRPEDVDDAVQHVYLAGMKAPPRDRNALKGWVRTVLGNFVRERHRTGQRRVQRETVAARQRDPAVASAEELAARVELQREVAAAVLRLDEPFKTVLLLRFYDGKQLKQVAEICGITVDAVKSRQRRGLELLRADLKRKLGVDEAALPFALAPLLRWPGAPIGEFGDVDTSAHRAARPLSAGLLGAAALFFAALFVTGVVAGVVPFGDGPATDGETGALVPDPGLGVETDTGTDTGSDSGTMRPEARRDRGALEGSGTEGTVPSDVADEVAERAHPTVAFVGYDEELGPIPVTLLPVTATGTLPPKKGVLLEPNEGVAALDLADVAPADVTLAEIHVTPQHDRLLPRTTVIALTPDRQFAGPASIEVEPAVELRGAVRAEHGGSLENLIVAVLHVTLPKPNEMIDVEIVDRKSLRAGDRFALRARPGRAGYLVAAADDHVPTAIRFSDARELAGADIPLRIGRGATITGSWDVRDGGATPSAVSVNVGFVRGWFQLLPGEPGEERRYSSFHFLGVTREGTIVHTNVSATLFDDGTFRADGLADRPYGVEFHVPDTARDAHAGAVEDVTPPAELPPLVLDGAFIDVTATVDGQPVQGLSVRVQRDGSEHWDDFSRRDAGTLSIRVDPGADYDVTLSAPHHAELEPMSVRALRGERTPVHGELTPKEFASWSVRLLRPDGKPFRNVAIGTRPWGTDANVGLSWKTPASMERDGTHTFEQLVPGRWEVHVRGGDGPLDPHAWFTEAVREIEIPARSESVAEFAAAPGGRSRLTVRDAQGDIVQAHCWVYDAEGNECDVRFVHRSDSRPISQYRLTFRGRAAEVFPALPPGRYTFEVAETHIAERSKAVVEIVAGEETPVEIQLR